MTSGNQSYNAIAQFLNGLELDRHELAHVITLLAAQMPNASVSLIKVFLFAESISIADGGGKLTRVNGLLDPEQALGQQGVHMTNEKVNMESAEIPDHDWERPVVQLLPHPEFDNTYIADRHNTGLLCKFHSKMPPTPEEFEERNASELIIRVAYGHIEGGFNIRCQKHPPGSSRVELFGEFKISTFIPVRIEVIRGDDNRQDTDEDKEA